MSPDIASLIVDFTHRLEAAYLEADELTAVVKGLREQRSILLQQRHEDQKRITQQQARIIALVDDNRALRAQVAAWHQVAA